MADNNVDMFTNLTNSLLVIIVSFLPFKEAARTCVLSKRWQHIWRETTNMEFNENFFVEPNENEENQDAQRRTFIEFVRVFIGNYPQKVIKTFALKFSKPQNFPHDMQNFVAFATVHNVKELELDFSNSTWRDDDLEDHPSLFELPSRVYRLRGLESLKLFSCSCDLTMFTNFSVLKSLSLGWIGISDSSIKAMLVSCPLLGSLSLKKCYNMEQFEIDLPNSRLKRLVLDKCNFVLNSFRIQGPKLRFLKYAGKIGIFYLVNQNELVEAEIDLGMEPQFGEVGTWLDDFVRELYAAQILTVCSVLLQCIPHGEQPLGFRGEMRAHHLILKTALHYNEFCGIKFMFQSCSHLQKLTMDIGPAKIFPDYYPPYEMNPQEFWLADLHVVDRCVTRTLKVVDVKGFKGTFNELCLLRYIMFYGRVMEQINLYISDGHGVNTREFCMQRAQLLSQFQRASENLNVSVFVIQ